MHACTYPFALHFKLSSVRRHAERAYVPFSGLFSLYARSDIIDDVIDRCSLALPALHVLLPPRNAAQFWRDNLSSVARVRRVTCMYVANVPVGSSVAKKEHTRLTPYRVS